MPAKSKLMSQVKQILRLHIQGQKFKAIARICGVSKNTVKKYILLSELNQISFDELLKMDDPVLEQFLTTGGKTQKDERYEHLLAQMDYFIKELKRPGVTRDLLWQEYLGQNHNGYAYSQFCYHLQQYEHFKELSMVQDHDPGDLLYVDFTGKKMSYVDKYTGDIIEVQVFASILGFSQYSFVKAVRSQKAEDFLRVLSDSLVFYQGVPKGIVPDNLKSAVIKTDRFEPELNRLLEDFANHYGTAIIPARSKKPKDKALVENWVKQIYTNIFAPLRNRTFFSLEEINQAISEQLAIFNHKQFQRKDISRLELFVTQEKLLLKPLPDKLFEIKKYREVTVQKNCYVELRENNNYYSAPFIFKGKKVKLIYTSTLVAIYFKGDQIACHPRSYIEHKYVTIKEHLPSHHRIWLDRCPDYYLDWAKKISPEVEKVVDGIIKSKPHPEQAYKSIEGLKSIMRITSEETLIKACHKAIELEQYNYSFIKRLTNSKLIELPGDEPLLDNKTLPVHKNIRGKDYYQLKINL